MKPAYEQYTEELHQRFGYLATWLPNVKLQLGDVGVLNRDRFERVSSLEQLGIPFTAHSFGSAADYEYTSSDSVEIGLKAGADAQVIQPVGNAEIVMSVSFKRANAVVFIGQSCKSIQIANLDEVGRGILARHKRAEWAKEHVVITELIQAQSATILISSSNSASVDFALDGGLGLETIRLADASGSVRMVGSSGIGTKIVGRKNLSPLFRASGVVSRFLRDDRFKTRSVGRKQAASAEFTDVYYND
jgi:hypothetical protein